MKLTVALWVEAPLSVTDTPPPVMFWIFSVCPAESVSVACPVSA
jgi:hypothetical protein